MDQGFSVVIYPVSDLAQAKTLYRTLLGVEPYVDEAYYVRSPWPSQRHDGAGGLLAGDRHSA